MNKLEQYVKDNYSKTDNREETTVKLSTVILGLNKGDLKYEDISSEFKREYRDWFYPTYIDYGGSKAWLVILENDFYTLERKFAIGLARFAINVDPLNEIYLENDWKQMPEIKNFYDNVKRRDRPVLIYF